MQRTYTPQLINASRPALSRMLDMFSDEQNDLINDSCVNLRLALSAHIDTRHRDWDNADAQVLLREAKRFVHENVFNVRKLILVNCSYTSVYPNPNQSLITTAA